jgi:pimeloyl-ACP methyl ester carboxylesterase
LAEQRDVVIESGEVTLTGTSWFPDGKPQGGLVMHPGSGPSDRDNGGYFIPLRSSLLQAGYAISSFDKRGVGGSSGRWEDAPIEAQARDLTAAAEMLMGDPQLHDLPVGLFGHSQGGWVALDAASRDARVAFVIVNSGPAVTPAAQERYAARRALEASGATAEEIEVGIAHYDLMVRLARARTPWDQMAGRRDELAPYLPDGEWAWHFWMSILDHDPRKALRSIHVPILTLWGEDDPLVPVEESIDVFRAHVPPTRLTVERFEGADHRVQIGDPPRLAPGYVGRILAFLESHSQS